MSQTNNLLFAVGNINTPQEGAAALLTSIVLQAFDDVRNVELSQAERRDAKYYMEDFGNEYVSEVVGKPIPMEMLVTC